MRHAWLPLAILALAALGCVTHRTQGTQSHASAPTIAFGKPSFESLGAMGSIIHIQVTNTSNTPLEFIQAHVAFYDKNGNLLTSQNGYCENSNLASGGKTVAKIMADNDKRAVRYEVTFSGRSEGSFGDVELNATPAAK